jgi:hypothetical protein
MPDLFARLAERAHGQAARMAPRLPARFETPVLESDVTDESTVDGRALAEPWLEPSVVTPPARKETASPAPVGHSEAVMPRIDPPPASIAAPMTTPGRKRTERLAVPSVKPSAAAVDRIRPVPPQSPMPAPQRSPSIAARAAAQPAVHISIGRIEVRAVSPAPAAPTPLPAPAPPPDKGLTLAAYLRGDDGRPR